MRASRFLIVGSLITAPVAWSAPATDAGVASVDLGDAWRKALGEEVRILEARWADLGGGPEPELAVVSRKGRGGLKVQVLAVPDGGGSPSVSLEVSSNQERLQRLETLHLSSSPKPRLVAVLETPYPDEKHLEILVTDESSLLHRSVRVVRRLNEASGCTSSKVSSTPPETPVLDAPHCATGTVAAQPFGGVVEGLEVRGPKLVFVRGASNLILRSDGPSLRVPVARLEETLEPKGDRFEWQSRRIDLAPRWPPDRVEVNRQAEPLYGTSPSHNAAMDGDLSTAWRFAVSARPHAVGEQPGPFPDPSMLAVWSKPTILRLVRLVPGCLGVSGNWARHHEVRTFRLEFSTGMTLEVDLDRLDDLPKGVRAMNQLRFGEGSQVLLLLERPVEARWARLRVLHTGRGDPARGSGIPEACVTELAFH